MLQLFHAVLLAITICAGIAHADVRIASWNIERLGHGDQKSYAALAAIGAQFDFIAVQEVMTEAGITRLEEALEKQTDEPWSAMYSHAIGRGSYKEMYAFVWREAAVEYVDGAVVYLDRTDRYAREPYSARFRSLNTGTEFVAATVHVLYGKSAGDRTPEIEALSVYWGWLEEVYQATPRILLGDFNLAPGHAAWEPLRRNAEPMITAGATTVSSINGRFANLYDNIWVSPSDNLSITQTGIYDGPATLGWDHEKFRKHVSDHVPIYLALGTARVAIAPTSVRVSNATMTDSAIRSRDERREVRGNRNSKVYHLPTCPSFGLVSDRNRVAFPSEVQAVEAGFRKARNCP